MEPITVVAALGSVNHLVNITKGIATVLKESGKSEALEKLIDLNSAILDLQQKHAELFNENVALKEENRLLKARKDLRAELTFEHGIYKRQVAGQWEYYCSVCLDRDGKFVQVARYNDEQGSSWSCSACNNTHHKLN